MNPIRFSGGRCSIRLLKRSRRFAIMQITGVDGDGVVQVAKCTTDSIKLF